MPYNKKCTVNVFESINRGKLLDYWTIGKLVKFGMGSLQLLKRRVSKNKINVLLKIEQVKRSMPQSSVIGPLLFIYIDYKKLKNCEKHVSK